MSIPFVNLELAFDFVSCQPPSANEAYISMATGEVYLVSVDLDSDELPEDVHDAGLYLAVPHKNDLDLGVSLVWEFVRQHVPGEADRIEDIFRRAGAYGRFKNLLERLGQLGAWYRFEEEHTRAGLLRWCAENGVEVVA